MTLPVLSWAALGWALAAILLFWGIGAYNRLMRLRNAIGEAYVALDQHMGERAQVCTQLLERLRPLLPSEQATFDSLDSAQAEAQAAAQAARARPHAGEPVAHLAVAGAVQQAALTRLMSLLEHQHELRAEAGLDALVDELKLIERQRAFARQVFNQAVTQYNAAAQQFPTRVLAGLYGFAEARTL
ncbi:LemA family protein [Roseateles violae]|uniref:LemA family protein n=1 Tax=Roseateles violae TaxID=3058042 RepID=A0ABT8DK31_9BURK|nr:LemA family protein [Pelomonas sp. PFR6]MDN3918747.1 LemA family protein [Pelomonas sp. PFR6]